MKKRVLSLALAVIFALSLMPSAVFADEAPAADITPIGASGSFRPVIDVNIRDARNLDGSNIIGVFPAGTVFEAVRETPWWVQINFEGRTAYVNMGYLREVDLLAPAPPAPVPAPAPAPVPERRTPFRDINPDWFPVGSRQTLDYANALYVRMGPGVSYRAFSHLVRGAEITVLDFRSGWVRIEVEQGFGWISAMYLRRP